MDISLLSGAWLAAGLTLCVYSFLWDENPLFRFAEHLYLGVSVGYYLSVLLFNVWFPKVQGPLLAGDWSPLPAVLLGGALLLRVNRRLAWLSRFGFALIIGYGAGLAIPAVLTTMLLKQVQGIAAACTGSGGLTAAVISAAGTVCVLCYFFFSAERTPATRKIAQSGTYFIMAYLGASFGVTVMSRLSLLYGRLADLHAFSAREYGYAAPVLAAAVLLFLIKYYRRKAVEAKDETV